MSSEPAARSLLPRRTLPANPEGEDVMEKSAGRPKLSPKIGDEEKPSAVIHRPPRGPPQNPVWFPTIFTPIRDFRFFGRTQILSKVLKDFGKNLRNLRKPPKRHSNFALECQNSARQTCILAKLAKLANFEKLAKLALQVCTLSATVCSSAVTRGWGGKSSERCSEGPDVLLYIDLGLITRETRGHTRLAHSTDLGTVIPRTLGDTQYARTHQRAHNEIHHDTLTQSSTAYKTAKTVLYESLRITH